MSPKQKPLVVIIEDDRSLAAALADQLLNAGLSTQVFHKGATALKFVGESYVHLVLLDPNLPDLDGLAVLDKIRRLPHSPAVIFLSALRDGEHVAQALEAGADDFVGKPHHPAELIARIHAVLRRSETAGDSRLTVNAALGTDVFLFNGAEVHPERLELIFAGGKKHKLGRKELGILYHLHANPGVIISRHSLIHAVWGVHADIRSRSLDQYVAKIRDAFEDHGRKLDSLRTIHGIGYWYEPAQAGPENGGRKPAGLDSVRIASIGGDMDIRCYLKPSCGWSNGVRAIMAKYALNYVDVDIINNPANYAEMVEKSGQRLSPCVEIDGVMLPDISGAEVEQYLLANKLVVPNDKAPAVPIDAPCTDAEHEKMRIKTIRFF